jgi:N-methylhydantoinase A
MTRALRSVSSEKGRDPRDFAIVAYGGSGPVHAAGLADDLGVRTIVVPPVAGLFSAVGLLFARPEFHDVRTCHLDVDTVDPTHVAAQLAEMRHALEAAFPGTPTEWAATAELRYGGQSWEVEVPLPEAACDDKSQAGPDLMALRRRFEDEHERLYGVRGQAGSPVELRAVRLAALGLAPATDSLDLEGEVSGARPAAGFRSSAFDGELVETPVRERSSIGLEPEPGPLLVDEYDTTVVVPPGWAVRRDEATASLILERRA